MSNFQVQLESSCRKFQGMCQGLSFTLFRYFYDYGQRQYELNEDAAAPYLEMVTQSLAAKELVAMNCLASTQLSHTLLNNTESLVNFRNILLKAMKKLKGKQGGGPPPLGVVFHLFGKICEIVGEFLKRRYVGLVLMRKSKFYLSLFLRMQGLFPNTYRILTR